jgi:hypothetical protein
LLGLEHVRIVPGITKVSPFDFYDYPISHSLLTVLGWSMLVGGFTPYSGATDVSRWCWASEY